MLARVVQASMSKELIIRTQEALMDEQATVEAARKDPSGFAPLYEKYYSPVLGFVYNRVEDKDQAFDITSQVFHQALESLHRYSFQGVPFSAWLYRIALNVLGKSYRAGKVRRTVSITDQTEQILLQEAETDRCDDITLFNALQTLKEEEMQLVEMRFFEKRPFAEIAAILGQTESAVKQRLYKILTVLKERIGKSEK